jgi:hypothetical protein
VGVRYHEKSTPSGPVAQLGARMNGIHEVTGSIPVWSTNPIRIQAIDVPMLLRSSNWSDSRQRLQSGLCLGFANSLPLAVGAMVFEVCQIGVLRREQPVFLGLGLRP